MTRNSRGFHRCFTCIIIFFTVLGASSFACSQNARNVELQIVYEFSSSGNTDSMKFTCMVPGSIENVQTVREIKYSHTPKRIIIDNDNSYAQFDFDKMEQVTQLSIDVSIDIHRRDFKVSGKRPIIQDTIPDEYLSEEKYIELSDPEIILMAESLDRGDPLKTAKNIYRYVCRNIEYSGFNDVDLGAAVGLSQRHGDCSEITDVFVALCRARNIPCRFVEGITTDFQNTPFHAWPEIYLEENGWVRVDPTPGHAINFSVLYNNYIQLSNTRSDKVLGKSYRYKYIYWGSAVEISEKVIFN